jgi:hypothetical protein
MVPVTTTPGPPDWTMFPPPVPPTAVALSAFTPGGTTNGLVPSRYVHVAWLPLSVQPSVKAADAVAGSAEIAAAATPAAAAVRVRFI